MFKETLRFLDQLNKSYKHTMEIKSDEDGYIDKECPNEDCISKFKVDAEDWENRFSDDVVFCPFCGHEAPAQSWLTTEQIDQLNEQAIEGLKAELGRALERDTRAFNRHAPKGFITMSMKFSGTTYAPNLPANALEEMQQKITCEKCGTRYAVVGSAFYCPCCGYNSAKQTFINTIKKVEAKISNLETIRAAVAEISKDEAARTCTSLLETSVPDLVVALQRLCECVYPQIEGSKPLKKNVFQRLDDGNCLWKELVGKGYDDWINPDEYRLLKTCFQQRHILQHKDGIIDDEYISKSGDMTYKSGQHLVIKPNDVMEYTAIVSAIGTRILQLLHE